MLQKHAEKTRNKSIKPITSIDKSFKKIKHHIIHHRGKNKSFQTCTCKSFSAVGLLRGFFVSAILRKLWNSVDLVLQKSSLNNFAE